MSSLHQRTGPQPAQWTGPQKNGRGDLPVEQRYPASTRFYRPARFPHPVPLRITFLALHPERYAASAWAPLALGGGLLLSAVVLLLVIGRVMRPQRRYTEVMEVEDVEVRDEQPEFWDNEASGAEEFDSLTQTDSVTSQEFVNQRTSFIDVGAHLGHGHFWGKFERFQRHRMYADYNQVVQRAAASGVRAIIIPCNVMGDSIRAQNFARRKQGLFHTVGVHPQFANTFRPNPERQTGELSKLIRFGGNRVVAVGVCGFDFSQLDTDPETQQMALDFQFDLAEKYRRPMIFCDRLSKGRLARTIREHRQRFPGGLVHSFEGTMEDLRAFLDLDLYIGISGCSMKKKESLKLLAEVPLDRIVVESVAPFCNIEAKFAASKYITSTPFAVEQHLPGRNEPCNVALLLEALANLRPDVESIEDLTDRVWRNTCQLFWEGQNPPSLL